jgi:hypothetical protein
MFVRGAEECDPVADEGLDLLIVNPTYEYQGTNV